MKSLAELGAALEAARAQQNVTYTELARAAGLTPLAVRQALQARTAPKATSLMAMAQRLGLELVLVPTDVAEGLGHAPAPQAAAVTMVDQLAGRAAAGLDVPPAPRSQR